MSVNHLAVMYRFKRITHSEESRSGKGAAITVRVAKIVAKKMEIRIVRF